MFCILMQVDKKLFENFFGWECSSYGGFRTLKLIDFLHAGTNLCKLKHDWKFLDGYVQKWVWPVWPQDSKIDCISEMSRWNKLIFSSLYKFRNVDSMISGWKWSKMAIKICYIWRMNVLSWFFECWKWCNAFWLDWYPTLFLLNTGGPRQ